METGNDDMMKQAKNIWSMLDELADSDPDSYKKFIETNLKKGKEERENAVPWMCVRTCVLKPKEDDLYINICSWARIPKPKTSTDPISVSAGKVVEEEDKTGPYNVVRVAFNPEVLQECAKNSEEQDMLIDLAIKYLKEQKKLHLSQNFQVCKNLKFKGDPKNLSDFFSTRQNSKTPKQDKTMEDLNKLTPDSLLSQLRISSDQSEAKNNQDLKLNNSVKQKQPKSNLIEEIASMEVKLDCPKYDVSLKDADAKRLRRVVVRISLPDVESVQDCELDIAQEELSLLVTAKYELHLPLPETILEEDSTAKFNNKTYSLTVTMPTKLQTS